MEKYSIETVVYRGSRTQLYILYRDSEKVLKSYDGILPLLAYMMAMKVRNFEIDGNEMTMEGFELLFR